MIPIFRPTIRRADMDAVLTRLAEDSIGVGTVSREFSLSLAKYVGKRSGISLRSYGHALLAAFRALELEAGARIGLSALAPVSVYNMVVQAGLEPVLIDSDRQLPVLPSPLNYDYEGLVLSALYVDSRLGYVADMENLRQLRIPIIEDISEGLGGHTGTAGLGSFGDMTVVAMEPGHIITAGGGAVVLTSNNKRVSSLNSLVDERIGEPPLPDMNAALGITQLKQLESFIERRREIAARFVKTLQRGKYRVPLQGGDGDNVFLALPVMIDGSPREVEKYARGHGVTARRAFSESAFSAAAPQGHFPETNRREVSSGEAAEIDAASKTSPYPNAIVFASRMVLFPLFPTLGKAEQEQIERVLASLP